MNRRCYSTRQTIPPVGRDLRCGFPLRGLELRTSPEGLRHFEALSADAGLPIVVYNVPPRTVVDIDVATLTRIATLPGVIGVKDASADPARPSLERQRIGAPFAFLSGQDATAVAYNAAGGTGCISVTVNVVPAACVALQRACRDGDFRTAMATQDRLTPLHAALFVEPSPAGVGHASARIGLCRADCRLPMVPLQDATAAAIDAALDALERRSDLVPAVDGSRHAAV